MNKDAVNFKAFNETTVNYQAGANVQIQRHCFAYSVTNIGTSIVEVNGKRLFPSAAPATIAGDSLSVSAPAGQVYKGVLKISFIAPLGAGPNVEVTQLYYLDPKDNIL